MEVMEYFREMSPLASRISEDIDVTRSSYQDIWNTLNQKERDQVINEALIDPAAVLKYHSNHIAEGKIKPYSKFSWFTKSQLNLCGIQEVNEVLRKKSPCRKGPAPDPPVVFIPPSPVAAKIKRAAIASPPCEPNNLFSRLKIRRSEDKQPLVDSPGPAPVVVPVRVSKPKTPPPPPPAQQETIALLSVDEIDLSIPKTGFDFLDNW